MGAGFGVDTRSTGGQSSWITANYPWQVLAIRLDRQRMRLNFQQISFVNDIVNINSPCINICVIDAESGYCSGCFRTIDEISHWPKLTPQQKIELLRELEDRRKSVS